ncbi:hypothetical protein OG500_08515 [Kitasatospora sp. NBC_01250]|uniref:hypothetical protein n=1 Tax=unclassified Kitasatospora TaxID=2633591 RepID=UPI002E10F145|nr:MULTISPECIES: hypothetical protein [unclassified Kitasatospora]WSJ66145.1 hypothetical protein OG294_08500 [Kitasatospora sp. NBC_01302]
MAGGGSTGGPGAEPSAGSSNAPGASDGSANGSDGSPDGGAATGSPAPTSGAQGAVGRVVLKTYQDWWAAQVSAYSGADPNGAQVRIYSSGTALGNILTSLQSLHDAKMVMNGKPVLSPVVQSVDLASNPQRAVIEDCVDVSGWHQVDAADGSNKDAPQRLTRYPAQAVLLVKGSIWTVFEFNRETGRTC